MNAKVALNVLSTLVDQMPYNYTDINTILAQLNCENIANLIVKSILFANNRHKIA